MLQHGKDTGLPETYRITLAVSVAFLAHTLLVATLPFELPVQSYNPVSVRVQLMPQGSLASSESAPSQTGSPVRATPFTIEKIPQPQPTDNVAATSTPQPRSVSAPSPVPLLPKTEPSQVRSALTAPPTEQSTSTQDSAPSIAGDRSIRQSTSQQELTLKSATLHKDSSYRSLLAQTIAQKGEIPKLDDFDQERMLSVELELNLMSNGALIGARITESSGNDGLDQRVYRAALAASPYPEPPSSSTRQQRFRVEVKYTF